MTVQTTTSRADYTGNGSTTAFTVPFYFLDSTHIQVLRTQLSTGVVTTLALTTDYTVAGAGVAAGGTITCLVAPTTDQKISILRNVPLTQLIHYVPNDPFPAATHEQALDQLTMGMQQLNEAVGRSLLLSANTTGISTSLPTPAANKIIAWNGSGAGLTNLDPSSLAVVVANAYTVVDKFTGDGANTNYILSNSLGSSNMAEVAVAGVTQNPGVDYSVSGRSLSFSSAPPNGAVILARYIVASSQSPNAAFTTDRQTATASQTVFTLAQAYIPSANSLEVYVNGLRMTPAVDYAETSSTVVTFNSGLTAGDEVTFVVWTTNAIAGGAASSVTCNQGSVGATTRTLQSKLSETVSVKDFGAVGDGVTDDTAAIQAAIDSFNPYLAQYSLFSGVVFLPKGTYKVSQLLLRNGVVLRGDGRGTRITGTTNAAIIKQSANTSANGLQTYSAFGIQDLNIVGSNTLCDGSYSLQDAIYLSNSDTYNSASYSFIKNVHIFFAGGNGINVYKPTVTNSQYGWTQFGRIEDVIIQGCYGYGFLSGGVTGNSDFSSMYVNINIAACYSGGFKLTGGNDNYIRALVNNTGTCVTPTGTYTNTACDVPFRMDNQLSTTLWLHCENTANSNGKAVEIGNSAGCFTTVLSGLFYNFSNPLSFVTNNGVQLDNLLFLNSTAGQPLITTTSACRRLHLGRNWYSSVANVIPISDGAAGTLYSATGYLTIDAIGNGPTRTLTSSVIDKSGEGIGYGTGVGQSIVQATSKATSVTSNTITGKITTASDALAAGAQVIFSVNCSKVAADDLVIVNLISGAASTGNYEIRVTRADTGFFIIGIKNTSAGSLSETLVLKYAVIKGASA